MTGARKTLCRITTIILLSCIILTAPHKALAGSQSLLLRQAATSDKTISLTFDMGSSAGNTPRILDILAKYDVKSTFFLTGQFVKSNPELTKKILSQGHEIGNHSYSHPNFRNISVSKMKSEISSTHEKIIEVCGKAPEPFFRPPYGSYNSSVLKAAGELGYDWTVMWTIDTVDWKGISSGAITRTVINNAKPGRIVLMHVSGGAVHTPEALPSMIEKLQSMGYTLVTISDLLSKTNNSPDPPKPASPHKTYTIKRGDTLWRISRMFGLTVQDLAKANNIPNPNLIYAGHILIIPQ